MPALEDMRSLTHEITQTHRQRAQAISGLKGGVSPMLSDFNSMRQNMSQSQRASLDRAAAANRATVIGMVKGFRGTRKNMSRKLHSDLTREAADRSAMSIALHNGLTQEAAARTADVQSKLADLERGRHIMARNLEANLSREDSERRAMSQSLRGELARHAADLKAEVQTELKDFRTEHRAVQAEWHKLAVSLHSTMGGQVKMAVEPQATAPTPAAPTKTAEPAVEDNSELAVLRTRVFEFLADRPDGARLVEIEEALGASRFQMSRALRSLMDDSMAEKRDMLYFAV
ncbi:MAG: hypothetical protein Q7R39_12175 [Dehalococcoidia bacterium]|nr:hypothetical protein [Dehalococcoidia bacterium]